MIAVMARVENESGTKKNDIKDISANILIVSQLFGQT